MKQETIKKSIEACEKLLTFYRKKIDGENPDPLSDCPLCTASCRSCLWLKFENVSCEDFYEKKELWYYHDFEDARDHNKLWMRMRIPMLERWVNELRTM